MAWANANRLCPQVNAYTEALIQPSDGRRQMPVAASSLPAKHGAADLAGGGQLAPPARLPHSFIRPTRCLLLLPPWQLCPLACSSTGLQLLAHHPPFPPPPASALSCTTPDVLVPHLRLPQSPSPASPTCLPAPGCVIPPVPVVLALSHISP